MSAELKACPCCGGEAIAESSIVEAQVRCTSCRLKVTRMHSPRVDTGLPEAIAAWNTRAPAQMSDAEIIAEWEAQCDSTLVSHPRETWVSKAGVLAFARALLAQGG